MTNRDANGPAVEQPRCFEPAPLTGLQAIIVEGTQNAGVAVLLTNFCVVWPAVLPSQ